MNYFLGIILLFLFLVTFACAFVNFFRFFTKLFLKRTFDEWALLKLVIWFSITGFIFFFITDNAEWFEIKVQKSNPSVQIQGNK